MRAIVYSESGTSDVLRLEERPVGEPGPGELRVRIAVSGVNPTDWKNRSGGGSGTNELDEQTPNQDGAGVVDAVGEGVNGFAEGDRVWLYLSAYQRPSGTAQEYAVVLARHAVRLPDGVSFDVGASLGVPAMTAHRALTVHEGGPTRLAHGALEGRTVLVAGGAGAVGHAAIQLAHWAGATVITTVSSASKAALAASAGADVIVNYREEDAAARIREAAPDGVDLIVEVSPARNAALDAEVLAPHGSVAVYATDGGGVMELDVRAHFVLNARYQFVLLYTVGQEALDAAAEDITAALLDDALPVGEEAGLPLTRFALEDTAAAHDAVSDGTVGKVLVDVADL
ncbi:NADPH:quinone reductase [Cnuibacter physcomitrellae]|uniref:NADPH:quinone reductase n=1 Tax=Cnuibacter physcomitrellae TaxID=1619308 RepID=A0A1X9LK19_9MICO|nr:NADPH:quinone reductase [Cnuibacter physcomitrellae]ARJ04822.1 NADPH:quinone reductase [Cnuibacter physcomitrellae]GGI41804.1 NADPH:quinone reductase [Cnuibacter physcomitrellae]